MEEPAHSAPLIVGAEPDLRFVSPCSICRVAYWVHLILPFDADLESSWLPTLAGIVLAFCFERSTANTGGFADKDPPGVGSSI